MRAGQNQGCPKCVHVNLDPLWPALILASPHVGQPSFWPTLTLASHQCGQHSLWPTFILANPHFDRASFQNTHFGLPPNLSWFSLGWSWLPSGPMAHPSCSKTLNKKRNKYGPRRFPNWLVQASRSEWFHDLSNHVVAAFADQAGTMSGLPCREDDMSIFELFPAEAPRPPISNVHGHVAIDVDSNLDSGPPWLWRSQMEANLNNDPPRLGRPRVETPQANTSREPFSDISNFEKLISGIPYDIADNLKTFEAKPVSNFAKSMFDKYDDDIQETQHASHAQMRQ